MVQSACQYVEAYRFGRASKISGYDKMTFFGNFGHFDLWSSAKSMANVTVPQQAGGPDFPPIYVSTSFRYIIICGLNGSKTFMTTQCTISNHFLWSSLPLGSLKIWSKSFFWLVSILSPVENSKQNQSRNVFSYDFSSSPIGYTKKINLVSKL